MKLVDLNPSFYGSYERGNKGLPNRLGLAFDCPICAASGTLATCGAGARLHIPFSNPLDGAPPLDNVAWQREGEDFQTMTLVPSINAMEQRDPRTSHWHGYITKGEIITL